MRTRPQLAYLIKYLLFNKCNNPIENLWAELTTASKEAYKPDSVTPARSGGMGQNSQLIAGCLWEAT